MKVECLHCHKIEELTQEETKEIGEIVDRKDLGVEDYIKLLCIFKSSKDKCEIGFENKHRYEWNQETKNWLIQQTNEYRKNQSQINQQKDKLELIENNIEILKKKLEIEEKNRYELIKSIQFIEDEIQKIKQNFQENTGTFNIQKFFLNTNHKKSFLFRWLNKLENLFIEGGK